MDFSSAITAQAATAASDFETNLLAVVGLVLPILIGALVARRVLRFVR